MFSSVITKNLNWEILSKNLVSLHEKFRNYVGSLKNPIFKGDWRKTNI